MATSRAPGDRSPKRPPPPAGRRRYACAWRQFGVQATGMNLEEVGVQLVGRFGPEAKGWLAEVPNLAARLAARWGFVLGELFESGASSVVLRCQWSDGTPAVLKLSPDRALLTKQVEMLRVFAPSGRVPAVLSADAEAGAIVLEEVLPGTVAEDMPQTSLPQQWGELLAALHAVAPPAHWPLDLRGRFDESFVRFGRRLSEPAIGARIDQATRQRAIRRCERLSDGEVGRGGRSGPGRARGRAADVGPQGPSPCRRGSRRRSERVRPRGNAQPAGGEQATAQGEHRDRDGARCPQALHGPLDEGGDEVTVAGFIADRRTEYHVPHGGVRRRPDTGWPPHRRCPSRANSAAGARWWWCPGGPPR